MPERIIITDAYAQKDGTAIVTLGSEFRYVKFRTGDGSVDGYGRRIVELIPEREDEDMTTERTTYTLEAEIHGRYFKDQGVSSAWIASVQLNAARLGIRIIRITEESNR